MSSGRQAPIGFTDSVELWIQDAIKAGGTVLRPHITRIALESEAAVDWLESKGLVMTRTAYQAVGDLHPRSVTALGLAAGRRFVIALHETARMLGVTTLLNARATTLERPGADGLAKVSVRRTLPGGVTEEKVLRAGGVVIATGRLYRGRQAQASLRRAPHGGHAHHRKSARTLLRRRDGRWS